MESSLRRDAPCGQYRIIKAQGDRGLPGSAQGTTPTDGPSRFGMLEGPGQPEGSGHVGVVPCADPVVCRNPASRLALHVLIDPEWSCGRDVLTVASAAIEGGATVIQLRDKKASTRLLVEQGLALRKLTRERGVLFIVNDRVDVALAVDADGVHVGQDEDMPLQIARRLMSPQRILGVSVGNVDEVVAAVAADADYLSVGPIFSTYAKSNAGPAIGTRMLAELATRYQIPIIGIGGITAQNAGEVLQAGAVGVAVITAVISAEDVVAATRELGVVTSAHKGLDGVNPPSTHLACRHPEDV